MSGLIGRSSRIGIEAAGGGRGGSSEGVRHGLASQRRDTGEGIQIAIDAALRDGGDLDHVRERILYVISQSILEALRG